MFKQSISFLSKLSYLPRISLQCSKFPLVALVSHPPYVCALKVCYYRLREINNYEFCMISGGGGGGGGKIDIEFC